MAAFSPQEQLLLELINRARMDPAGEAARFGISLTDGGVFITATPKQVLAPNVLLQTAAETHSLWMNENDSISQTGEDGSTPQQRMTEAGYGFASPWFSGEAVNRLETEDFESGLLEQHRALLVDSTSRAALLNGNFREAGIGTIAGSYNSAGTSYSGLTTTMDFARSGASWFVTGVSYSDTVQNDDFYSIGEGKEGRTVKLYSNGSVVKSSATSESGGYALNTLALGQVEIVFSGGGLAQKMGAKFNLIGFNVKVDMVDAATIESNTSISLTRGALHAKLLGVSAISAYGTSSGNTLTGNSGANSLVGFDGADRLLGGKGNDMLSGGIGNDFLRGDAGADTINGGSGFDQASYQGSAAGVSVDLALGRFSGGDAEGDVLSDIEALFGSSYADVLKGNALNNTLQGGSGGDTLMGGSGNDTLRGGRGNDKLYGNAGSDRFEFREAAFGRDTIIGFQDGIDHLIFKKAIADSFSDFTILQNHTTEVTVVIGSNAIKLTASSVLDLTASDFLFI